MFTCFRIVWWICVLGLLLEYLSDKALKRRASRATSPPVTSFSVWWLLHLQVHRALLCGAGGGGGGGGFNIISISRCYERSRSFGAVELSRGSRQSCILRHSCMLLQETWLMWFMHVITRDMTHVTHASYYKRHDSELSRGSRQSHMRHSHFMHLTCHDSCRILRIWHVMSWFPCPV